MTNRPWQGHVTTGIYRRRNGNIEYVTVAYLNALEARATRAEERLQVAVAGLKGLMAGIGSQYRLKDDGTFDLYWDKGAAPALVAGWNAAIDTLTKLDAG